MFGFPEKISDWSSREYLRLFAIVMFYITLRPLIQKFYTKLGERQRNRDKKQLEDEQIRRHQQQRVKEKLGLEEEVGDEKPASSSSLAESKLSTRERRRLQRQKAKAPVQPQELAKPVHDDGMPSDEDVSDLLA